MKIAIVGDTHFGARNDVKWWSDYMGKFYENVLFPRLQKDSIQYMVQLGDLFDRRKYINFNTAYTARKQFFDRLSPAGVQMLTFPGNHDVYYKNTLEVNSISLLLNDYIEAGTIAAFYEPTTKVLGKREMDFIPWICEDNKASVAEFTRRSKSKICFGHFQLQGYEMEQGHICVDGMDKSELRRYDRVYSGHFHHRSSDGTIHYVGSPGEMTWADYEDSRGFHILDLDTLDLEFVRNPYQLHHKYNFDGAVETIETINARDYSFYEQTIVRIVVRNRVEGIVFDTFMKRMEAAKPIEIQVEEVYVDNSYGDVMDSNAETYDTGDSLKAMSQYIEAIDMALDKDMLKNMVKEIHSKAIDFDNLDDISL